MIIMITPPVDRSMLVSLLCSRNMRRSKITLLAGLGILSILIREFQNLLQDEVFLSGNVMVSYDLTVPSITAFLPHTKQSPRALVPAIKVSRGRRNVSMVIGIPTVKREVQSYLVSTLESIFNNMNAKEISDTLVIILISETNLDFVHQVLAEIQTKHSHHLESGALEVISPPSEFYPNMTALRETLGDKMDRVVWRSKQVLDFSFLMMYGQGRGTFYVQLEDDIITKKGFISTMKNFAQKQEETNQDWFVLDFCSLGYIGKLFRSSDLLWIVQFFLMFYNDKPVDWLLVDIMKTKVCGLDHDHNHCKLEVDKLWIHYTPSLFQHMGTHSSLKGKKQKLKDPLFKKDQDVKISAF